MSRQLVAALVFAASSLPAQRVSVSGPIVREKLETPLRFVAEMAGKRLLTPGFERSTLTGTLTRGAGQPIPVRLIKESGKIRIEETGRPVVGVSDSGVWKAGTSVTSDESDTLETLLYDSIEEFLAGQQRGAQTRFLGTAFRMDDGTAKNYTGPYYNIYQVDDIIKSDELPRRQPKTYYINSKTLFLDRVQYNLTRGKSAINVDTVLSNWQKFGDEFIPVTIQRLEGGKPTLTLTISTASFTSKATDGLLDRP